MPDSKKSGRKQDATQKPSVLKCVHSQDNLRDNVNKEHDVIQDNREYPERCLIGIRETRSTLKCTNGKEADNEKPNEGTDTNRPKR